MDELTERLRVTLPSFRKASAETGFRDNPVSIFRIKEEPMNQDEVSVDSAPAIKFSLGKNDAVVCGSVNEILKFGRNMERSGWLPNGRKASGLIVDEASMMLFPDFLALATMVAPDGGSCWPATTCSSPR